MAQGSKPGEGGQLPGHKVTEEIARLRHTQPGVALISPAPHHDIYSIEDLSQLIYDLKQVNPRRGRQREARRGGRRRHDRRRASRRAWPRSCTSAVPTAGPAPRRSRPSRTPGCPWEIGLADTQQALVESGLRGRVRVRVDGGLKTGRDVHGGRAARGGRVLVRDGRAARRGLHHGPLLPPGHVPGGDRHPEARAAGEVRGDAGDGGGVPHAVAEDVRVRLASLGLPLARRSVGRTDLLRQRSSGSRADASTWACCSRRPLDERSFTGTLALQRMHARARRPRVRRRLAGDPRWPVVGSPTGSANGDRTVGARLGGAIGHAFGEGAPPGRVRARSAGGRPVVRGVPRGGVEFHLVGEANDYVGKGMGGGRIVITPPSDDAGDPWLAGNTVLYGATGGELFVNGRSASASPSATPARWPSSRAPASTPAST